jgi:hypothetical protein
MTTERHADDDAKIPMLEITLLLVGQGIIWGLIGFSIGWILYGV